MDLVQGSAPERLELKQQLLAAADRAAACNTLICSSTSGFRSSLLQADMENPECLLVAHPVQLVYLLPLIELWRGERRPICGGRMVEIVPRTPTPRRAAPRCNTS
nr:3-hydroxyacyl-CoA dehydrogenase NAD-binding domain-containing protein [Bradyrhizobium yuanmingense]